jgi:hypothetical protein
MFKSISTIFCSLGFLLLHAQTTSIMTVRDPQEIRNILKDPSNPTYQYWLSDQTQRDEVVRFCDKEVENIFDIKTNIFQFKDIYASLKKRLNDTVNNKYDAAFETYFKGTNIDKALINAAPDIKNKEFKFAADTMIYENIRLLITFSRMDVYEINSDVVKMSLSQIKSQETVEILLNYYEDFVQKGDVLNIPEAMQKRNFDLISARLTTIQSNNYVMYQSPLAQARKIKAVYIHMDNDVFAVGRDVNQDREYTGGGAVGINTDYLKCRWFNFRWISDYIFKTRYFGKNVMQAKRMSLSYQSIRLGMHFFTPYIRYRENFALADTLFKQDRPFGSFIYVERSKHRVATKGVWRGESSLQIGKIGTNAGRDIQATLHKDAITSSQKVYGWEKQVANGGRWAAQVNYRVDFLLLSNTNKYISALTTLFPNNIGINMKSVPYWRRLNLYNSSELFIGTYYTALGTGLFLSAMDFKSQSTQNMIAARKKNVFECGFNWELGARYRRVVHNTMLEGLGLFKTFEDDPYDDESESVRLLAKDEIRRNMLLLESKLSFRFRKSTLYLCNTLQTKEYDPKNRTSDLIRYAGLVKPEDQDFYANKVIPEINEFNKRKFYAFGRVGIIWMLE